MRAVCFVLVLACGITRATEGPLTINAGSAPARVAFSPDGKALAVGSAEALKLFDPATGKELSALAGHAWPIRSLAYSPDGKLLISGAGGYRDGKRGGGN